ncbi:MAG TPA: serine hydrolase, partial [Bacteroidia bacterium]|nr:serine hydrolase [Bacteroidia bacterium]
SNSFQGVLEQSTLLNMWTGRHTAPQNKRVMMCLGWFVKDAENLGKYYWHVGDNPGFSSTLMVFPENDFGITILTNGMYAEEVVWNKMSFDIINLFKNDWEK